MTKLNTNIPVIIYADGGCHNNGVHKGKGGYGAILKYGKMEKIIYGGEINTTSNRMELMAAIKAIQALRSTEYVVKLHSDSQYVVKGVNEWSKKWIKNGWRSTSGSEVVNIDLWKKLLELVAKYKIEFIWVRGHTGHELQETAHTLAEKLNAQK